jgi:hypothetical protein
MSPLPRPIAPVISFTRATYADVLTVKAVVTRLPLSAAIARQGILQ